MNGFAPIAEEVAVSAQDQLCLVAGFGQFDPGGEGYGAPVLVWNESVFVSPLCGPDATDARNDHELVQIRLQLASACRKQLRTMPLPQPGHQMWGHHVLFSGTKKVVLQNLFWSFVVPPILLLESPVVCGFFAEFGEEVTGVLLACRSTSPTRWPQSFQAPRRLWRAWPLCHLLLWERPRVMDVEAQRLSLQPSLLTALKANAPQYHNRKPTTSASSS